MKRIWVFLAAFCSSAGFAQQIGYPAITNGTVGQVLTANSSGAPTFQGAPPRTATKVVCAPDTPGQPAGCDVVVQGLEGSAGSTTGAEVTLNPLIVSCGSALTPTFNGQTSGSTLTVNTWISGSPIYLGMPINAPGQAMYPYYVTAFGTGTGGAGTYTLSASIGTIASETMTGPQGACKMLLREGTYNICAPIIIDRSFIDITGESNPMWGGYVQPYGAGPAGSVGSGVTKIQQNTGCAGGNTYNLIAINDTNVPDDGEARHRGWALQYLYLSGSSITPTYGSSTGIYAWGNDDGVVLNHVMAQHLFQALYLKLDNAYIYGLDIQDVYAPGQISGEGPKINSMIAYDFGQSFIVDSSGGWGAQVVNSFFGDCGGDCLDANSKVMVEANIFSSGAASAIRLENASIAIGNLIDETAGQYTNKTRTVAPIREDATGAQNVMVEGNIIIPNGTESEYCIDMGASTGDIVTGNHCYAGFNGGAANVVNSTAAAGSNVVAFNLGDITALKTKPIYTVSTLPSCNATSEGETVTVSDASSPTYGGALTGGSTTVALALCNGSAWMAH